MRQSNDIWNKKFLLPLDSYIDDDDDDSEQNTNKSSFLKKHNLDDSLLNEEFYEEDDYQYEEEEDQLSQQSINNQSLYEVELFHEFKDYYNENTYVEYPDIKLFYKQIDKLTQIPINFVFQNLQKYQETMNRLHVEAYFLKLRESMQQILKKINYKGDKQSFFPEFQTLQNYKVREVCIQHKGLFLSIQVIQKLLKYQKEQWQIKNDQLIIFKDKNFDKIYLGKAFVPDKQEKKDKSDIKDLEKHEVKKKIINQLSSLELNEELFKTYPNIQKQIKVLQEIENDQFKLIDFEQIFFIWMDTKDDLKDFLKNIDNIENNYLLLIPNEYYLSLQKVQNSQIQFRCLNFIAFEDQTIHAKKGEAVFPNYQFLENKTVSLESYKKLIEQEVQNATKLDRFQKQALSKTLHNQNSLIQGPPGTGKTFLAAYLVDTLIRLKKSFCKKPILVVSKKNVSLDELLIKIHKQNPSLKILRLGNQSKNQNIKKFNLQGQNVPKKIIKCHKHLYNPINYQLKNYIEKKKMNDQEIQQEYEINKILQNMKEYKKYQIKNTIYYEMKYQQNLQIFIERNGYQVIGMTLTCYHMHFEALKQLEAEIVIVEEASEIIESEFFPILTPWLKHLIQLGDHLQLKPFQRAKKLEQDYNYKMSYFERLITVNQIEMVTLYQQRRMRPQFAEFTRLFYGNKYTDDPSVYKLEYIRTLSTNGMYLLPHTFPETMMRDRSYINQYEATFIYNLVYKLTAIFEKEKQYHQITVLSMYKSQKILIQNKLSGFENIQSFTVDEFQGNESDIIILSCVRSNIQNKCGFIKEDLRINVAFSRAKIGFFCIGNLIMLEMKVQTWKKINTLAQEYKTFGRDNQSQIYKNLHFITTKCLQKLQNKKGYQEEDTCNLCNQSSHIGKCIYHEYVPKSNQVQIIDNINNKNQKYEILKQLNDKDRNDILSTEKYLKQINELLKSKSKTK